MKHHFFLEAKGEGRKLLHKTTRQGQTMGSLPSMESLDEIENSLKDEDFVSFLATYATSFVVYFFPKKQRNLTKVKNC
jgi:hypothetical protein